MTARKIWRRAYQGSIPEIVATGQWLEHIAAVEGWPADPVFALQVCAEELLTNSLRYGGREAPRIALALAEFDDRVELTVEDDCRPFDVAASLPHRIDRPLDEVQPGGLGVQLIHRFADELSYERTQFGNRVVVVVKLPAAAPGAPVPAGGGGVAAQPQAGAADQAAGEGDIFRSSAFAEALAGAPPLELLPGEALVAQGAESDAAYFLEKGDVTVFAETPYGPVPLASLKAPRLIGEIGVLADLPRTASIRAATPASVYRIDRPLMQKLGATNPTLLLSVIAQLGRQIDGVNKTIGLYTNALSALERQEFDPRILDDLQNPPPQLAEFAATFRRFAGQILDRRRQREEMASAAAIQQSLLPRAELLARISEAVDVHAAMRPAREVGGDFYDLFMLDEDRLAFAIGDICGKGLPASLFMAIVVSVLRTAARDEATVAAVGARSNAILCRDNAASLFATVFFGVLDVRTGRVEYCNCGHNAPLVVSAGGAIRSLPATGIPLALFEDRAAAAASVTLDPGDALVLYTDGVTEAVNPAGEEFGEPRLADVLQGERAGAAEATVRRLFDVVDAFAGDCEQADDITCVVIRPRLDDRVMHPR